MDNLQGNTPHARIGWKNYCSRRRKAHWNSCMGTGKSVELFLLWNEIVTIKCICGPLDPFGRWPHWGCWNWYLVPPWPVCGSSPHCHPQCRGLDRCLCFFFKQAEKYGQTSVKIYPPLLSLCSKQCMILILEILTLCVCAPRPFGGGEGVDLHERLWGIVSACGFWSTWKIAMKWPFFENLSPRLKQFLNQTRKKKGPPGLGRNIAKILRSG